ncbi:hypothetical protein HDU93_007933 [Gonapodya sp. JEL0774]|nr:hypothetical protein HDU93_007933 [Gonapodya sp. JEL0774]
MQNLWDEQQKLAGKDPDHFRRDLYDAIRQGAYPEWELGIQTVPVGEEDKFDFDILDSTKIIPEDLVPIRRIGKITLDRVPDNFFAQVEQAAFAVQRVIPGITFSNDPLLQSRIFAYHDTQLHRLGPNFHQLPTNRSVCPVANNQRDGAMQMQVHRGNVNYYPTELGTGEPHMVPVDQGGYMHSTKSPPAEAVGRSLGKVRAKAGAKWLDHDSQAQMFWNSMSEVEKKHIIAAAWFELGKCTDIGVRERMVGRLNHVDFDLACQVARAIGVKAPEQPAVPNNGRKAKGLSQLEFLPKSIQGRKIAVVAADGVDVEGLNAFKRKLEGEGAIVQVISVVSTVLFRTLFRNSKVQVLSVGLLVQFLSPLTGKDGETKQAVDHALLTSHSTFFDALVIPSGTSEMITTLKRDGLAVHFVNEAFKHCKPLVAWGQGVGLLGASDVPVVGMGNSTTSPDTNDEGGDQTFSEKAANFAKDKLTSTLSSIMPSAATDPMGVAVSSGEGESAGEDAAGRVANMLKMHRFWAREADPRVPA